MPGKYSNTVRVYYPEPRTREEVIEKVLLTLKEIKDKTDVSKVILFGSYAKGRQTASSDVDVLVIYEEVGGVNEKERKDERKKEVYNLFWNSLKIPQLELHVYSSEEFERLKKSGSSFLKEIEKGIVIWSRDR